MFKLYYLLIFTAVAALVMRFFRKITGSVGIHNFAGFVSTVGCFCWLCLALLCFRNVDLSVDAFFFIFFFLLAIICPTQASASIQNVGTSE